jgi:CRISPR-associated protein Cas2
MQERRLYLAAYDISDPRRLRQALKIAKGFATGGQKSVFECFLTEGERSSLIRQLTSVIDPEQDAVLVVRLDPRSKVHTLGIAVPPVDALYFYHG